jgi:DUF4097 and DUF4098 domain-containing protein YvlB
MNIMEVIVSKSISLCWQPGYKPTKEEVMEAEKQVESFVGYIRMTQELKDLKKSFKSGRNYTTQQVKQVIDARLKYLIDKNEVRSDLPVPTPEHKVKE